MNDNYAGNEEETDLGLTKILSRSEVCPPPKCWWSFIYFKKA